MTKPAIRFETVSKAYRLGASARSLHAAALGMATWLWGRKAAHPPGLIWALREVTFQVRPGEVLGVIGPNGAGKSTLLKLLSGITRPTEGEVEVYGRVGSLIELGAGFHPDLTGRENVFLNGQIMGMSRKEIAARYPEIVEFSGLGEFMGVQVKRYSSGMYARLGFAVATHMDPDILLVDEVLSVGDAAFQRKSLERMLALVNGGKTVVFVSHNLIAVERLCGRLIWLERGEVRAHGKPREVIQAYLNEEERQFVNGARAAAREGRGLRVANVTLLNGHANPTGEFHMGQDIEVDIRCHVETAITGARFNLGVVSTKGVLFLANMLIDGRSVDLVPGGRAIRCRFKSVPLMPGAYQVFGEVWGPGGYDLLVNWSEWGRFRIVQPDPGLLPVAQDYSASHMQADAPVSVVYDWRTE